MTLPLSRRSWAWTSLLPLLLVLSAAAAPTKPTPEAVLERMKAALEPAKASTRTITITVHSASFNENTEIVAREARKYSADGGRSVTVVIEPESLKGVTLLVREEKGKPNVKYAYYPVLRRARRLSGTGVFESFLGTDFTYADVGLVEVNDRALKLLGTKRVDNQEAYELQETPKHTGYYSRIVDSVAVESGLPLERDHYDVANRLRRKQVYKEVTKVGGVPTPIRVRVEDVQSGDWTEIKVTDVNYDIQVPDEIFDPAKLREVVANPLWSAKKN
jgi:outer membrane lipoprotein-sorting protein